MWDFIYNVEFGHPIVSRCTSNKPIKGVLQAV